MQFIHVSSNARVCVFVCVFACLCGFESGSTQLGHCCLDKKSVLPTNNILCGKQSKHSMQPTHNPVCITFLVPHCSQCTQELSLMPKCVFQNEKTPV